jgi:phosphoenolpyruvate-protein phosphotransferase/dihydroxyacetone kinase phosphotransfer subunit
MVGIVVVSHSPDLAQAAVALALQMVKGPAPRIKIAAGTPDHRLGTDAAAVAEAVAAADDGEGVVVIMDLGSALLSAELALELLPQPGVQVRLVPAAFVEGIFAAVISAAAGGQLDAVARDAEQAVHAKAAQLGQTEPATDANVTIARPAIVAKATIVNPDGIHARPAALIVEALASLDAQVTIATEHAAPVSARSPTALMSLGTRADDVLRIEADGAGAEAAVDRIVALVRDGFGEMRAESFDKLRTAPFDELRAQQEGISPHPLGVSPGRVVGPALRMPDPITEPDPTIRISEAEQPTAIKQLAIVAAAVAEQLRSRSTAAGTVGQLLEATAAMATDPDLIADASMRIRDFGMTPERAIWEAIESVADTIRGVGSRQAERVADLYDIRNRIVSSLAGQAVPGVPDPGYPFVLLAVDLAPADAAGLDASRCLAVVTEGGGPTSHTAIIARSLAIPAVVVARGLTTISDGTMLVVDGSTGEVIKEPTADQQATASTVSRPRRSKLASPGCTADGHRIALLANIGSTPDVTAALECGAEGVGLYRTEFCFLGRTVAPSIAEQIHDYRAVFSKFAGRRVVVRTLDAGSDKPMPFLGRDEEPNPALGVRGFRTAVANPEILNDQLKAIKEAAAAESADVGVMAPMIASVDEARAFAEAARAVGLLLVGVMIETPAAALQAELILAEVDFLSIGTNDLAQYLFAADRQSRSFASLHDPWQPALLRLIEMVTTAASLSGKPVGVCGEAAADPLLALVLAGLGVSSLSMAPGALADVGRSIAAVTLEICRQAARAACDSASPDSAREAVREIAGFDSPEPDEAPH